MFLLLIFCSNFFFLNNVFALLECQDRNPFCKQLAQDQKGYCNNKPLARQTCSESCNLCRKEKFLLYLLFVVFAVYTKP